MIAPGWLGATALALVLVIAVGCGEDSSTSSADDLSRGDEAARRDLLAAYRVAEAARRDGVRCKLDPAPDCNPAAYPPPGALVPEIGSALLRRFVVRPAATTDAVIEPRSVYVVAEGTNNDSVTLAERTPGGRVWVLHGSASGKRITEATGSTG